MQMAKSLRSKHRRRMRSVKREKFGKKEVERLKGILKTEDAEMKELYTVKQAQDLKKSKSENTMEVDKNAASINPNTLQNAHGNYPVWMSQKKQRQLRLKTKKAKKKAKKAKR